MEKELVVVLNFGGQYNQLIARRVRECNVYCEVHPYSLSPEIIREMNPKGIIFTGGSSSVYGEDSLRGKRSCLIWKFRFWESATALSLWHVCWVAA